MRIASPWSFKSSNYHLKIYLKKRIDLRNKFPAISKNHFDCSTDEILITFSKVVSSINETDYIIYHEIIIKCKVCYNNKTYYYPIITFVDDAYSVIRGYYLGFEKIISDICVCENIINVKNKLLNFIINVEKTYIKNQTKLEMYPFILIRDWRFDEKSEKNDIVSLDIKNYKINEICEFAICNEDLNKIINEIGIDCEYIYNIEKVFVNDEFVLEGIIKL